ncbi:hypothetical protein D9M70_390940 [compost metagenome]
MHNEVRHDLLKSDAKQVATTLRQYLLYPLLVLNRGGERDPRRLPRFQFDLVEPEDLGTYAEALPKLVEAGLQIPVNWAHDKLRIPLPGKNDAILGTVQPALGAAAARVAALKTEGASDPLGDLAEQMSGEWQPIANMTAPVQQLLANCKSLEEFRARLPEVIPQMDASQLAEQIAQGLFASTLAGRTGAV